MSRTGLSIRDAEASLPALDAAAQSAAALKAAMFEKISTTDVGEIMAGVVKRAKDGHVPSIKLLLDAIGKGTPQVSVGVRASVRPPGSGNNGQSAPNLIGRGRQSDGDVRLLAIADLVSGAAQAIALRGPTSAAELAKAAGRDVGTIVDALTDHEFFAEYDGKYQLTAKGKKFIKASGE